MTTKQAPTLFGKRMRWHAESASWYGTGHNLVRSVAVRTAGIRSGERQWGCVYWFEWDHFVIGKNFKTPQSAARDAERYLRRLHKALGKVIGDE